MEKNIFEKEMNRAKSMKTLNPDNANYWDGFMRGIRRVHHREQFGTQEEHQAWLNARGDKAREQRAQGYRDGLEKGGKVHPGSALRSCRVCGCTDEDCSGCIERTGAPCHWVEEDLCSACANSHAR